MLINNTPALLRYAAKEIATVLCFPRQEKNMNQILFSLLTILFWLQPFVAQAYPYDPRVYSPLYPQCIEEYNRCDEPCLTQMGGNASYACHNVCAANFDKCIAGDSRRQNVEEANAKYRLKQECDSRRSSCELYTCDKFHGMGESRACFESCKAQANQCMAAIGLASQPSQNQSGRQWKIRIFDRLGTGQVHETAVISIGNAKQTITISKTTPTVYAEFNCPTGSWRYAIKTITALHNGQGKLVVVSGEGTGTLNCNGDGDLDIAGDYSVTPVAVTLQRLAL
jgi:hypothetical protein